MTIMGINFTKINVEKKKGTREKVNISNNVAITDVEKINMQFSGADQQGLRYKFTFVTKFEPEIGVINLEGEVIYMTKKDKAEEILALWTKSKRLDPSTMSLIMNNVLNKCNIEAILLSKEMNLPSPVPLPRVNVEQKMATKPENIEKTAPKKAKK